MDQALMNHMIAVGKAYYNGIEDAITEDYLQDVVGVLGQMAAAPVGGEVYGHPRTVGLDYLLRSPNLYPTGPGSSEIKALMQYYDTQPAQFTLNGQPMTNGDLRRLAIRKYWPVHDIIIDDSVATSTLAKGKHISSSNKNQKIRCACLAITRTAFGENRQSSRLDRLVKMGRQPQNELVYYMMVLPLVMTFCLELNPHMALDPKTMLRKDMSRVENNIKTQLKAYGSWSEQLALFRINLPVGHPQALTGLDEDMLSGIEVRYLRWYTCFMSTVSLPWDEHERCRNNFWITPQEKQYLFVGYDARWLYARFGRPRGSGVRYP